MLNLYKVVYYNQNFNCNAVDFWAVSMVDAVRQWAYHYPTAQRFLRCELVAEQPDAHIIDWKMHQIRQVKAEQHDAHAFDRLLYLEFGADYIPLAEYA